MKQALGRSLRQRSAGVAAAVALLVVGGCDDGTDCCVDHVAAGVMEVRVLDTRDAPVAAASVEVLAVLESGFDMRAGIGKTDAEGKAELLLGLALMPGGEYPAAVVVRTDEHPEVADTTRGFTARFYINEAIRDTTHAVVRTRFP